MSVHRRIRDCRPALVLALALAFGAAACSGSCNGSGGTVPSTVGKSEAEARKALEDAGLDVTAVREKHGGTPGLVVSQTPRAGEAVPADGKVRIVVEEAAASQVSVPAVIGKTATEAEAVLTAAGLRKGNTSSVPSPSPAGTITEQNPKAAALVAAGTSVDLVIAAESVVRVPNLVGQTETAALQAIAQANLKIGQIFARADGGEAEGTVVEQNPRAGVNVVRDEPVEITVREKFPMREPGATEFFGTEQDRAVTCTPGQVIASFGSNNKLRLTGPCRLVTVGGTGNTVTIESAGAIYVGGTQNRVTWSKGLEGLPRLGRSGEANVLERAPQ